MLRYFVALQLLYSLTRPYHEQVKTWFRQNNLIEVLNTVKPLTAVIIGIPAIVGACIGGWLLLEAADLVISLIFIAVLMVCALITAIVG